MPDPVPPRPDRRQFLRACAQGTAAALVCGCSEDDALMIEKKVAPKKDQGASRSMPVLFVGHGSPMNAIENNDWSRAFQRLGLSLRRPKAVLAISAHWCARGSFVTADAMPKTIHDFGGFPKKLYEVQYPALGSGALCARVRELLQPHETKDSRDWGLDHGTWTVAKHFWPDASVPIVQLSIDERMTATQMLAVGRSLRELRDEGVLVLASGNVTHNLRDAFQRMESGDLAAPAWATTFDESVKKVLADRDEQRLVALLETDEGRLAHPHPDHWWPMLFAVGATTEDDERTFPIEGFDLGSLSMLSVQFGA